MGFIETARNLGANRRAGPVKWLQRMAQIIEAKRLQAEQRQREEPVAKIHAIHCQIAEIQKASPENQKQRITLEEGDINNSLFPKAFRERLRRSPNASPIQVRGMEIETHVTGDGVRMKVEMTCIKIDISSPVGRAYIISVSPGKGIGLFYPNGDPITIRDGILQPIGKNPMTPKEHTETLFFILQTTGVVNELLKPKNPKPFYAAVGR